MTGYAPPWEPAALRRCTVRRRTRTGIVVAVGTSGLILLLLGGTPAGGIVLAVLLVAIAALIWVSTRTRRGLTWAELGQRSRLWWPQLLLAAIPSVNLARMADWERGTTTVLGFVLVQAAIALALSESWRQSRAARRWLRDPPGPPR